MRLLAVALALLTSSPALAAEAKVIDTAQLAARMKGPPSQWDLTLVDARTEVEFSDAHIPGAVLVRANEVGEKLPSIVPDRSRTVVFYCNGPNCTKTVKAAKQALAAGYTDVLEYKEGIPGWGVARRPIEGKPLPKVQAPAIAPEALKALLAGANPPLVVDIRDADEFAKFRIAQARSVPIDDLPKQAPAFPAGQPIVLVDHAGHQSPLAVRLLASFGRTDVKRLDGGMIKWQQAGLASVSR
jgi:rhodanese-related sulfurtransferase